MTTQVLLYERAVPLSAQRHAGWSVKLGDDHGFARSVNSVPLLAVEFPSAAAEYAIVFAGSEKDVTPAVLLGMRDKENLYVDDAGKWDARYVPAFIRRYPFVFATGKEESTLTLCIDEQFGGCNEDGKGEHLFDADGEQTQYLRSVLAFQTEYQKQHQRTRAFCRKVSELGLLEPVQAQFRVAGGETVSLRGFMAVNRDRLKALGGDALAELARTDELELLYLHLHSLRNVAALAERSAPGVEPEPAPEPAPDAAPKPKRARRSKKKTSE